jgi:hypothetical protein
MSNDASVLQGVALIPMLSLGGSRESRKGMKPEPFNRKSVDPKVVQSQMPGGIARAW